MSTDFVWSVAAIHYIAREPDKSMMDLAKFLCSCDWSDRTYYGVHVHYQADAYRGEGLIFMG